MSRKDPSGEAFETVFDIVSLGFSVAEVIANPYDVSAWVGVIGDAIDLVPFVTGVGETVRGLRFIDKAGNVLEIAKATDFTDAVSDTIKSLDRINGFTKSTSIYPYDDPETGKHFDFEWRAQINSRTQGTECPFLTGHAVWKGFNDLETCYSEIALEWHPTKNRRKKPDKVYKETTDKYWWKCPECGHEWYASVRSRTVDENGCRKCREKAPIN